MCALTNLNMANNARCWKGAANGIIIRKSILFWCRALRFKSCACPKHHNRLCVPYICVCTCGKYKHHHIGYMWSGLLLFSWNQVENANSLFPARHFRLFVPTESILMPSGCLYTNKSKIIPPEAKCMHTVKGAQQETMVHVSRTWVAFQKWD